MFKFRNYSVLVGGCITEVGIYLLFSYIQQLDPPSPLLFLMSCGELVLSQKGQVLTTHLRVLIKKKRTCHLIEDDEKVMLIATALLFIPVITKGYIKAPF